MGKGRITTLLLLLLLLLLRFTMRIEDMGSEETMSGEMYCDDESEYEGTRKEGLE